METALNGSSEGVGGVKTSERRGLCPVEGTSFELNSVIELEWRDRVVGSGSAQHGMLSAGADPDKKSCRGRRVAKERTIGG